MVLTFWLIDAVIVAVTIVWLLRRWHRRCIRAERMRTFVAVLAVLISERGAVITDVLRRRDGYRKDIHAWALALNIGCSEEELVAAKQDAAMVAQDFFAYFYSAHPDRDYRERGDGYRWRRPRPAVVGEEEHGASVDEP